MAGKVERDEITGVETTGHEWDGIKELNNPLPRWWVLVFYATIAFSVLWWILYPSWPTLKSHTRGLLGYDQRTELAEIMAKVEEERRPWLERIRGAELAAIAADPELLTFAVRGGEVIFKENCAACHGLGGAGQLNYPTLADDDWLWGGTLEDIFYTVSHGIRFYEDEDTRDSTMPAFGADGILESQQIEDVVQYVLTLSGREADPAAAERGREIFLEQCAACHGDNGKGMREVGAPNLTDDIWLYGGEPEQIRAQISKPRHGVMPAWDSRLSEESLKMVTIYVHQLGGGE